MEILTRQCQWKFLVIYICCIFFILCPGFLQSVEAAGPFGYVYGVKGGFEPFPAIYKEDSVLIGWATGWREYRIGDSVDKGFQTPDKASGKALGDAFDIVSLGEGGSIVLCFDPPIRNGEGWDFAVFENSFNDKFLELVYVEVSSDGNSFVRFPCCSLTPSPVNAYGSIDNTNIFGLAGKYRQGYGTPFDLQDIAQKLAITGEMPSGHINLSRIAYIKIVDIIGDRSCYDDRIPEWKAIWGENAPIFDPCPTKGSAGFDLDAIGARYINVTPEGTNQPPHPPALSSPISETVVLSLRPLLKTSMFSDPDPQDIQILTHWQIATQPEFSHPLFDLLSASYLTTLPLHIPILNAGGNYFWRVRFFDTGASASAWSEPFFFLTPSSPEDANLNGIPDDSELKDDDPTDLNGDGIPDVQQIQSAFRCLSTINGKKMAVQCFSEEGEIQFVESIDPNEIENVRSMPHHLPFWLIGLRLKVKHSGGASRVRIYFSEKLSEKPHWYLYDLHHEWQDYSSHTTFTENTSLVELFLQDGGTGDADGVNNGIIVNQGCPGEFSYPPPPPDAKAGIGKNPGCFISHAGTVFDLITKVLHDEKSENSQQQGIEKGKEYSRIISLAPSITEVLFCLNLGEKVVGVTDFCNYPEDARKKKRIGGYYNTSYETILSLKPDLIIMLPEHEKQREYFRKLGIEFLVVDQRETSGILQSILTIGKLCGKTEQAQEIIAGLHARLDHIKEKTKALPGPKVMICVGRSRGMHGIQDVYISGRKGFYNEWISIAGGINAYKGETIRYPTITGEGIIRLNPEVIIEMLPDMKERAFSEETIRKDWETLPWVDAVKNKRVYIFTEEYAAIPGPRFIYVIEHIARVIHPEVQWNE